MNTIRWNVAVSADTDQSLRMFLASQGGGRKGDLSRFIEEAVRAHILELSAEQAKAANAHLGQRVQSLFDPPEFGQRLGQPGGSISRLQRAHDTETTPETRPRRAWLYIYY